MLTLYADLLSHGWIAWLLVGIGLVSKELHDMFCQRDTCEIAEGAW